MTNKENSMDYTHIKMRSKDWANGKLKADFYISTELAGRILELIALNLKTGHAKLKTEYDVEASASHV
jgi:hypothetical protein